MSNKFQNQSGWDTSIARPFKILSALPRTLINVRGAIWEGESDTYAFEVVTAAGRIRVSTTDKSNGRSEVHQFYISSGLEFTRWNLIRELSEVLSSSDDEVEIGHILDQIHLLRQSTAIVSEGQKPRLGRLESAALRYLADGVKSDGIQLILSYPYSLSFTGEGFESTEWRGYHLPKALSGLVPTCVFVFEGATSLRHCEPVCLSPQDADVIEHLKECRALKEEDRLELDIFANMLRDLQYERRSAA